MKLFSIISLTKSYLASKLFSYVSLFLNLHVENVPVKDIAFSMLANNLVLEIQFCIIWVT